MGLLMPFLLGGLALAGIPWIIHRIRKPTSNPTPFSSLMFVPVTTPPVRQRKKIEHPWLMLLRMLVLAMLALAFSRPYSLAPAAAHLEDGKTRRHVLLVDNSLSASAPDQFEKVIAAARTRLGELGSDPVAVIAFNSSPQVLASLPSPADPGAGSAGRARNALDAIEPSSGATRYVPALQRAEQLLRPAAEADGNDDDEAAQERIIHLVTDLQRTGLPEEVTHYGLARGVSLQLAPVAAPDPSNVAVEAIALEARTPSTLFARVRLRNFGPAPVESTLTWRLEDATAAEQAVTVLADSSVVVALSTQADLAKSARIAMHLAAEDAIGADNTHYAVYVPDPIRNIGVVIDPAADRSRPIPFLEAAIAESQPVPWKLAPADPGNLPEAGAGPAVLVLPEIDSVTPETAARLAAYVEGGGRLLLLPSPSGFATPITEALLQPAGLTVAGARHDQTDPARYALLSWLDYDHPVFQPFRNATYSDFSMLRFNNHIQLQVPPGATPQVIARLESDTAAEDDPAIIAFERGEGRVVVWAFPLDSEWTNITRTRRFIPLLHETIALLLPPLPPQRTHLAAAAVSPPPGFPTDGLNVLCPGETESKAFDAAAPASAAPGFLRWSTDSSALVEAVNIDPAESDLRVFSPDEFLLRVGAVSENVAQAAASAPQREQNVVHWEYGYHVLVLLAVACLLESALAVYFGRLKPREQPSK